MSNLLALMDELRREQSLCDAVIRVQDSQFHVHKPVMCSISPFFKSLFTTWSTPDNNIFDIPDVSADSMLAFIEFAYTGAVSITKENITDLFIAADRFSVEGLAQACCDEMERSLSPQTCVYTWRITEKYYYPALRQKAFSYILRHFEEVVACTSFLQLSAAELKMIIESEFLNVKQESTAFEAVLCWINHSPQDRQVHIRDLLSKIRLAFLDFQYYINHVIGNELIRQNQQCKNYLIQSTKQMLDTHQGSLTRSSNSNYKLTCPRVPQAVIMAIGGWHIRDPTSAIEIYNSRSKRWVPMDSSDGPRAYHGTVFLNGCLYVIGGFDGIENFCTMHKYNLATQTWNEVAPMHTSRCYVSVALLDGLIYTMGGYDGLDRLETAEQYTPEFNQWTRIASMHEQRSDASAASLNGQIYIFGGFNGVQCLFTAESYNPQYDQWSVIPQLSCPRSGVSAIAHAGRIIVAGGFDGVTRLNTLEVYDPEIQHWRSLPSMIESRSNFGMAVLEDELYVVGGFNGFTTTACVESFNFGTGVWSIVKDMEVSRSALSCCILHDLPNMSFYSGTQYAEDSKEN
ncbi:unnamed protein product [Knipowitschia caucasica]